MRKLQCPYGSSANVYSHLKSWIQSLELLWQIARTNQVLWIITAVAYPRTIGTAQALFVELGFSWWPFNFRDIFPAVLPFVSLRVTNVFRSVTSSTPGIPLCDNSKMHCDLTEIPNIPNHPKATKATTTSNNLIKLNSWERPTTTTGTPTVRIVMSFHIHQNMIAWSIMRRIALEMSLRRQKAPVPTIQSVLLSLSFLQLGFSICGLGPSLLKLSSNTGEDVEKMGIVFTTRGIGYVLTAISVGLILDKFSFYSDTGIYVPKHPVGLYLLKRMEKAMVVVGIVLMAIGMFVTPLLRSFIVLALVNVIIGVGCVLVDVTSNILLCWIWGDAVNPYMQTLHFCFGVGALIFPLMLQGGDMLFEPTGTMKETRFWNVLSVAYYPSAASMVLVALMIIPFSFEKTSNVRVSNNNSNKHEKSVEDEAIETDSVVDGNCDEGYSTSVPSIGNRLMTCCYNLKFYVVSMDWKQGCVCLLTGAALLLCVGSEVGYGGLIYTYLLMKRKEEFEKTASLLTSMFWLSFSLGRLVSIPISRYVSAATMLIGDLVFALLGLIALVIWTHPVVIWVATIVIGLAMASQYPATLVIPTGHLNMKVGGHGHLWLRGRDDHSSHSSSLYHSSHVHAPRYHRFCHPHLCRVTVCIQEESPIDFNGNTVDNFWARTGQQHKVLKNHK